MKKLILSKFSNMGLFAKACVILCAPMLVGIIILAVYGRYLTKEEIVDRYSERFFEQPVCGIAGILNEEEVSKTINGVYYSISIDIKIRKDISPYRAGSKRYSNVYTSKNYYIEKDQYKRLKNDTNVCISAFKHRDKGGFDAYNVITNIDISGVNLHTFDLSGRRNFICIKPEDIIENLNDNEILNSNIYDRYLTIKGVKYLTSRSMTYFILERPSSCLTTLKIESPMYKSEFNLILSSKSIDY